MAFNVAAAKAAGYSDAEIQQYLSQKNGNAGNTFRNIPVLGGLLNSASGVAQDIGTGLSNEFGAGVGERNARDQANLQLSQAIQSAKTPQEKGRLAQIQSGIADTSQGQAQALQGEFSPAANQNPFIRGLKAGSDVAGVVDLPFAAKDLVTTAPSFLTMGGVGKKIAQKGAEGAISGAADEFQNFSDAVLKNLSEKYGSKSSQVVAGARKLPNIRQEIVDSAEGAGRSVDALNPSVNSQDYITLRQQAAKRIPKGLLGALKANTKDTQVDEAIREIATQRAKQLAPGLGKYDQLYRIYSKTGSPVRIASNAAISYLLNKLLPSQVKGIGGAATDIGLTTLEDILGVRF